MGRLLFTADVHAHCHAQFASVLPNGRNSRLQDILSVLKNAGEVAVSRGCDALVILGDLHHSRSKIDVDVLSSVWTTIHEITKKVQVILLCGNHDYGTRTSEVHSLEAYKSICTVIDKPLTYQLCGCFFQFFPYTADTVSLVQQLKSIPKGDILCLHQSLKEGALGPYGRTGHGELSIQDLPLDKFRFVFLGDFHSRQWLADGKVHYIGSPLQLNFGEAGEEKCFTLLDTDGWRIENIPTNAPKFYTFANPQEYLTAKTSGTIRPEIDFIRILHDEANRATAETIKAASPRVQVVEEASELKALQRVGNEVASSDMLLLQAYVDQKADAALDKDRLLAIGLDTLWGGQE